jgi:hypothetical protein
VNIFRFKGLVKFFCLVTILSVLSCQTDSDVKPTITNATLATIAISNLTSTNALSGGTISEDGGGPITARGVVWGTSSSPTVSLTTKTSDGTGAGIFSSTLTSLSPSTTYFVRAYAVNRAGTAYGNEISFTTPDLLESVLKIDATEYALLSGTEAWLFIVDNAGSILETKQLLGGEILNFTAATNSDSITLVKVSHYEPDHVDILMYGGIKRGTTLKFAFADGSIPQMPAFTGNASIKVNNYPTIGNNPLVIASPDVNYRETPNAGLVNASFPIYGDKTSILLSAFRNDGVPVYKLIEEVSANQVVEADFSSFSTYPFTIQVPEEDNLNYLLSGYDSAWEYYGTAFSSHQWFNGSASPAVMGYLPGYSGYYTVVKSVLPVDHYVAVSYTKRGTIPDASKLELPSFAYSIINASVKSPQFSIDRGYDYMHATWGYSPVGSTQVFCHIYTPPNFHPKLTTLPSEILAKYPQLDLDKLIFASCDFTEYLNGYTYEQTIIDFLKYHFHIETLEYRLYEFTP